MLNPRMRVLTIACGFAAAVLLAFVPSTFAQVSYYSYYSPYAVPAYVAPTVTYGAYYSPVAVTAYQPVAACNAWSGYTPVTAYQPVAAYSGYSAVTTYRPLLGIWTSRLVPYTTYRPVYTPSVTYAAYSPSVGCGSYVSYSPVVSYSPCVSCSPCSSYSPCGGYSIATCGVPSCSSCTAPAPSTSGETGAPATGAAPQSTFERQAEKTPTGTEEKLTPTPDAKMNSMPTPTLPDPRDRTTARPTYLSSRVALTALPVQAPPVRNDGGWRPSKD